MVQHIIFRSVSNKILDPLAKLFFSCENCSKIVNAANVLHTRKNLIKRFLRT